MHEFENIVEEVNKQQSTIIESFAEKALNFLKERNIEELIEVVRELNIANDFQLIKHQKFAEYCLRDILLVLHDEPEASGFTYLLWNILNTIHVSSIVRRTIWKANTIVSILARTIKCSIKFSNKKLQKVCTSFLSSILVGAPSAFYQQVGDECIIKSLLDILNTEQFAEETFQSVICCFGLLCDGTNTCKQQLIDLNVASSVLRMGERHALVDENFCHLAAMTYDDLSVLKIDGSIGRQKFLKTQINDVLYCSNPLCLKQQKDAKYKKCSQCKLTFYCSKECQVKHWRDTHYGFCRKK